MDGEGHAREGGGGEKRPRSPGSPEVVSSKSSKLEQQVEQHCSVFSLEKGETENPPVSKNNDIQGELPGTPITTGEKVVSPNRLDLLKECVDGNKSPRDHIDCSYVYKLICGLEWRLHNLEVAHTKEISELKLKHASDIAGLRLEMVQTQSAQELGNTDLVQVKQDLAATSEGVARLETFQGEYETRLDSLERIPDQVTQDTDTQMATTGEETNIARASDRVQRLQQDLSDHISNMNTFTSNLQRENRRRHLEWDQQEQYSRRDCVIVKGVNYKRGEDTTDIMCRIAYSIGVSISPSDISTSHRTGRPVGDAPRPIICKFTRRDTKHSVMTKRHETRHIKYDDEGNPVRIYIDENLTRMRARVCKKLRDTKTPHRVRDGKIHLTTDGENPTTQQILDSPNDWEGLNWPDEVKVELGIYPRD